MTRNTEKCGDFRI